MLSRYEVPLGKDELDWVHELRYTWRKLLALANELSALLSSVQVNFKRELVKNVKIFVMDVAQLRTDWELGGSSEPDYAPIGSSEVRQNLITRRLGARRFVRT